MRTIAKLISFKQQAQALPIVHLQLMTAITITPLKHHLFDELSKKRFILASTSPRRIEILQQIGFTNIEVIASNFSEDLRKEDYTPTEYVRNTAIGKARAVYEDLKAKDEHQNTVILAADTVIELEGKIYEKPKDRAEQLANLKYYRDCGAPQHVLSGVVVLVDGEMSSYVEDTKIFFDEEASDDLISAYVDTNEGLDVAAGYRVQMTGSLLMKKIEGDYYNVVGLPFRGTFVLLEKALQ